MSTEINSAPATVPAANPQEAAGLPSYTRLKAHSMRPRFKATRHRMVLSGNCLDVFEYERPVFYGFRYGQGKRIESLDITEDQKEENRRKSKNRAKKKISRLLLSNFGFWADARSVPCHAKFLTLTFRDPVFEVKEANEKFTLFIKRLNYEIFRSKNSILQYLAVIEIQPRSKKVHYHVVLFNLPYVPRIYDVFNQVWAQGYMHIKKISDGYAAARYITKYMTKDDDQRLRGQKSYFCSRDLKKPYVINDDEMINQIRPFLMRKPISQYQYENTHTGLTKCYQYDIADLGVLKSVIMLNGRVAT